MLHFYIAEQQINIPVVPEQKNKEIFTNQTINNKKAQASVEDPAAQNANQEVLQSTIAPGSVAQPKSIADLFAQISSAQVERYGGEAGALRVRLRGARAFEPSYYFNGLPLTGGNSGEQNLSLLPFSFVGTLNIYPDSPPFWLNSLGIGGDIDIKTCRRKECFILKDSPNLNLTKVNLDAGSFGYKQAIVSDSIKFNQKTEVFATAEIKASKEDYPVFNNQNSILHPDQGTYENLQNNDFRKVSAGTGFSTFYAPLGKITFDAAFGNQERGVPGAVGTISQERMNESLFIGTLRTEKLFAESGLEWNTQLGGLYSASHVNNLQGTYAAQANVSDTSTLQGKTWIVLPTKLISQEQTGLSVEVLQQKQRSNFAVPGDSSAQSSWQKNVSRIELRPALFEGLIFPIRENFSFSLDAQGWISYAEAKSDLTDNNAVENEKPVSGYTLSLQSRFYSLVQFVRYIQTERRPYLNEFYGSTGGVLPNFQLQSEKSEKIETGFNLPYGELGYFYARDKNLIFLQQTSPVTSQYQNIEDGNRQGVYLNGAYTFLKYLNLSFSYQYLQAKMVRDGVTTEIPRSPEHYFNGYVSLEKIPIGHLYGYQGQFGFYANMTYESPFYLDYANLTQMQIPPLYNAGFAFSFLNSLSSKSFILSLDLYNLLNETFSIIYGSNGFVQQVQSNGYLGYPPPGRRIYLSFTGEF